MTELSPRDTKLVQYLNEAYGKEKELETALEAHIGMTSAPPYKRRLQQHLTQTKRHAREVERRIKRIGGTAHTVPVEGLDPVAKGASLAAELGGRAMAAAKGPLHALRGTGEQEKMLKNAKTEYADEHEEIATYTAIETLAETVDDGETVKLARSIRREEEAMARFLSRLIPSLTKSVAQAEIPAAQRRSGRSRGSRRSSNSGASSSSRAKRGRSTRATAGARG
jgi:ferritin-like metal-binding protein YciE